MARRGHPALASGTGGDREIRAWRERLIRDQFTQPFKQAFREMYPVTPAEAVVQVDHL
jgi:Domain of unknown function (DUF4132)